MNSVRLFVWTNYQPLFDEQSFLFDHQHITQSKYAEHTADRAMHLNN